MRTLAISLLVLFLAACAPASVIDSATLAKVAPAPSASAEYHLGAGDKVRVIVFNEPTLTNEFQIGSDGNLAFPLIGSVDAKDKTPGEVQAALEKRLGDGYLNNPKVSIEVLSFRPFYILGEVNKPGQYPYAAGLTVLSGVATASGFTYRADKRVVYIRRDGASKEIPVRITPDLMISPGDTVRIGERYF